MMKTQLKLKIGKKKPSNWDVRLAWTNHAAERCLEREINEDTLKKIFDSVLPFIVRNLIKGDNRRLIVKDEKRDCAFVLDGMKLHEKNKDITMKLITVVNSCRVSSNQYGRDTVRLVKTRY